MKNNLLNLGISICMSAIMCACESDRISDTIHICTTEQTPWQSVQENLSVNTQNNYELLIDASKKQQQIKGFGACFNELGWTSLSELSDKDRDDIIKELFEPDFGANFTICRMPLGANDFSRNWYSYNEVKDDFNMYNFSIDNDYATLIPFIKSAQGYNPNLKIWASPWCPPSWMKHNSHYASAYTGEDYKETYRNGLRKDKIGYEGTDMFIMEPEYLQAYALYFKKFIQAYRNEGIDIFAVMPQNEFNSAQIFPSCCWTAKGLSTFIGDYLGPALMDEKVEIMLGTVERANYLLVDSVLRHPTASRYVCGVGFQWAGKGAVADIRKRYPDLPLYQTEQECGNGKNDLEGLKHSWGLLKHYIDNGVSVYDYWNISLLKGGISRWGWAQNSLVVVDPENKSYNYTLEYYLMKHISHFVKPGAYNLNVSGDAGVFSLAFENPDQSIIAVIMETDGKDKNVSIMNNGESKTFFIKANSINTIKL